MNIERFQNQYIEGQDISELVYEGEPTHYYYDYRQHLTEDDIRNAETYIDAMTYEGNSLGANVDTTMAAKYAMLVKMMYPDRPLPLEVENVFGEMGTNLEALYEWDQPEFIRSAVPLLVLQPKMFKHTFPIVPIIAEQMKKSENNFDQFADLAFYAWAYGNGRKTFIPAYDYIAQEMSEHLEALPAYPGEDPSSRVGAVKLFTESYRNASFIKNAKQNEDAVEMWLDSGQPHKALHEAFWLSVLTADTVSLGPNHELHLDFGRKQSDDKLPARRSF